MKIFTRNYFLSSILNNFPDPIKNKDCENLELNNWITSEFVVDKLVPVVGFKPFPLNELFFLTSMITYYKPEIIFDWGTHIGKSARIFHEICKSFRINSEIHSIDLPETVDHEEHPHKNRGKMVRKCPNVHLHLGDGVTVSIKIANKKRNIDKKKLFYLDGDHSRTTVFRELNTIHKNSPNSLILIHDTFYQSKKSNYNVGPFLAIKGFIKKYPDKYNYVHTEFGLPGMTALIPTDDNN